jgi:hypothetical protein
MPSAREQAADPDDRYAAARAADLTTARTRTGRPEKPPSPHHALPAAPHIAQQAISA